MSDKIWFISSVWKFLLQILIIAIFTLNSTTVTNQLLNPGCLLYISSSYVQLQEVYCL
jgi:hypothetical protein